MTDMGERVTFRLTTGQEILIGFREAPRQVRDRKDNSAVTRKPVPLDHLR